MTCRKETEMTGKRPRKLIFHTTVLNSMNSSRYSCVPNLVIAITVASPLAAPELGLCHACNTLREPNMICTKCKQTCLEKLARNFCAFNSTHDLFAFLTQVNMNLASLTKAQLAATHKLHYRHWNAVQEEIIETCAVLQQYKMQSTTQFNKLTI